MATATAKKPTTKDAETPVEPGFVPASERPGAIPEPRAIQQGCGGSPCTGSKTYNPIPVIVVRGTVTGRKVAFSVTGCGRTYDWNFGDGTTMVGGKAVEHTYAAAGTYTVSAKPRTSTRGKVGTASTGALT
jgi:PKD repeat protein